MTQSNEPAIEIMNEAIGIFMGGMWKDVNIGGQPYRRFYMPGKSGWDYCKSTMSLDYHKDWNELMDVVEQISKMPLLNHDNTSCTHPQDVCHPITFGMPTEDGKQVMFRFKGFSLHVAGTLHEAAHRACYEVAEYVNKQQQPNG